MGKSKGGFYAVRKGREPGIYNTWADCQEQVTGFAGAIFKKFPAYEEARRFIEETGTRTFRPERNNFNYTSNDHNGNNPNRRYFQTSPESSTASGSDTESAQRPPKREILQIEDSSRTLPPKRICYDTNKIPESSSSIIEEVEVYIKVRKIDGGEAMWKLCFPDYVKGANEYYSRGGLERNSLRAGLMAILRAVESQLDPEAKLLIFTNNEISVKCIKAWNSEWEETSVSLTEESDLIKKCSDEMRKCPYSPILQYVSSESSCSDQPTQPDIGWGDFEPFLSDDEDFSQMVLNKGKGKQA
ncbi:uncharacterized protein FA14DRAFT_185844 [Meira miltonrushii]|uniref:ribonuclease H n=1 Tax=Meira miltonrushii TaxID=1280837 RepID=A0A316V6E2_9BASI|nr:uncharacterized protein FA14DRAFT_185844 [Meira miltonrushii]PWN33076.1 hypothetical protein FA14DRAFT_185844 [Meira miltonrushii]